MSENTGPTLVNIKSYDPLYIDFTVSEKDLDRVRQAMTKGTLNVKLRGESEDKFAYTGELFFVDNSVDNNTGTIFLRAIIGNKDKSLWSGQFVKVRLVLEIQKDAILIPAASVLIGQKGPFVFVVAKGDKADLRLPKMGEQEDENVVIKEGIEPGETVVVTGQLGLSPGVKVIDVGKDVSKKIAAATVEKGIFDRILIFFKKATEPVIGE